MDDFDQCEAGRRAVFGGRWKLPCLREAMHYIANEMTDPIKLCDPHFKEVLAAGLISEPMIGVKEYEHREQMRASGDLPYTFTDLPAEAFPVTIEIYQRDTKKVVWSEIIAEPGVVEIPGKPDNDPWRDVRITYADGTVADTGAMG